MLRGIHHESLIMMTLPNGYSFRVTVSLCGVFTGHRRIPITKASDAGLWSFLSIAPEQTVKQTIETPVTWDSITLIMMYRFWWTLMYGNIWTNCTLFECIRREATTWAPNTCIIGWDEVSQTQKKTPKSARTSIYVCNIRSRSHRTHLTETAGHFVLFAFHSEHILVNGGANIYFAVWSISYLRDCL